MVVAFELYYRQLSVGCLAIIMSYLADTAQYIFTGFITRYPLMPLIITPIGFAFAAWVTNLFSANSG
jgi:hypothetical protein